MAEVLSQSQIDALLKGINEGEIDEKASGDGADGQKKVKEYDFKSPKKFTKEQLKLIDNLHENLGRQLSSYFSALLRTFSEVKVIQVEEQRYHEFNNALNDNTLIALYDLKPENEKLSELTILMDFSNGIAFNIIDRLLGGDGVDSNIERDMTDIERNIMQNVLSRMCYNLQEAWETYLSISVRLSSIETNPRLLQLFSPDDAVVIVSMELTLQDVKGTISICLPITNLEGLLVDFVPKYMRSGSKSRQSQEKEDLRKSNIENVLENADIDMHVVFETIELELSDVLRLQPNDVIQLQKPLDSDVQIIIDNKAYFTGTLGQSRNKKAVRINNVIE